MNRVINYPRVPVSRKGREELKSDKNTKGEDFLPGVLCVSLVPFA